MSPANKIRFGKSLQGKFGALRGLFGEFSRNRRANVAMIFALMAVPVLFATGMGVDYAMASRRRSKLDAAADSAALAAVTPSIMAISSQSAQQQAMQTAATNMFNALAGQVSGLQGTPQPTVSIGSIGLTQTVTVSYTANALTTFSGVIGKKTLPIAGTASASASTQPYINFYLLLDDSPSMAIAATSTGIQQMVSATSAQGGCAFACHEYDPSADSSGNPGGEDNYALSKSLVPKVVLRIDLLREAVQSLMTTAQTTEGNKSYYSMAIYTFDYQLNQIQKLTTNLTTAQNAASNIQLLEVYNNSGYLTKTNNNDDADTDFSAAMNGVNSEMATPGTGTKLAPQEFLFIVTDGVNEVVNGSRQPSLMDQSWCTTVKNRGIKIAVLYTQYLPLPTNAFYNQHVSPFQSQIGSNMQACASPGLYSSVTTDGDISAALTNLFNAALAQSAHLTN
jgi:Flp pilus assembly protein TadG